MRRWLIVGIWHTTDDGLIGRMLSIPLRPGEGRLIQPTRALGLGRTSAYSCPRADQFTANPDPHLALIG